MNSAQFQQCLRELAESWTTKDYSRVASRFADQVLYTDPVRYTLRSRAELLAFFEADEGYAQYAAIHQAVFDEARQLGAAEYTYRGTHQYHGTVWVKIEHDLIVEWREYQHIDARPYNEFCAGSAASPTASAAT
jgi:plasmid stabilization system protein ParE